MLKNLLAGTPTHSATSSPSLASCSPTHSSLQRYRLPPPEQRARLPFRTGFQDAFSIGLVCSRILRSCGISCASSLFASAGEGNENKWSAFGVDSKRTRRREPETLNAICTAPDFGYGLDRSGRTIERVCGVCTRSSGGIITLAKQE